MRRAIILVLAFLAIGTMIADAPGNTWTTSTSVPSSFRPNRSVTFSYTATSTSVADLSIDWMVHVWTCTDSNVDNRCTAGDARLVDWTEKRFQANGGTSATVSW